MQKIEMRVYCANCGDILTVTQPQIILNDFTLLVSPCKKCASQQGVQSDGAEETCPCGGSHEPDVHCKKCGLRYLPRR